MIHPKAISKLLQFKFIWRLFCLKLNDICFKTYFTHGFKNFAQVKLSSKFSLADYNPYSQYIK